MAPSLTPVVGSLVYCDLLFDNAEHPGIYIGGGKIADLDGQGRIKKVSPREFTGNITTLNKEIWIPMEREI